jgi:phage baseplate assembly protein W
MSSLNIDLSLSTADSLKTYTYRDIDPEFTLNSTTNDIVVNDDYLAIEGGIYNLFNFKQGERIINPEFGNSLYKYLYEPINDLTAKKIGNEIYTMFEKWEPRVLINDIKINPNTDQNTYYITILYSVPSLGDGVIKNFNVAINGGAT